jgi:Cu/Ag efflux protein CusF
VLALAILVAQASPNVYNAFASGQAVHERGTMRGIVERVDYASGTVTVRTSKGSVTVSVLPSTEIFVKREFATLADVHRGANAELWVNEVGGRLVAQVIRL